MHKKVNNKINDKNQIGNICTYKNQFDDFYVWGSHREFTPYMETKLYVTIFFYKSGSGKILFECLKLHVHDSRSLIKLK